jgi:hypothetical protein
VLRARRGAREKAAELERIRDLLASLPAIGVQGFVADPRLAPVESVLRDFISLDLAPVDKFSDSEPVSERPHWATRAYEAWCRLLPADDGTRYLSWTFAMPWAKLCVTGVDWLPALWDATPNHEFVLLAPDGQSWWGISNDEDYQIFAGRASSRAG